MSIKKATWLQNWLQVGFIFKSVNLKGVIRIKVENTCPIEGKKKKEELIFS